MAQWEREWVRVPGGFNVRHPELRHSVGLFRAILRGEVMYIGQAAEWKNGGLAKRIADFARPSPSGREHHGGEYIYDHLDELELEVLVTVSDKQAAQVAKVLRGPMLALHAPSKNVRGKRRPNVVLLRKQPAPASSTIRLEESLPSPQEAA